MILFICAADRRWRRRQLSAARSRRCVAPCVVACPPVPPWFRPLVSVRTACRWRKGLSDESVPGRAVLREGGPFGEGRRGDEVLEVAFEGPAESYLFAAGDARCSHLRQQKPLGKAANDFTASLA